MFYCIKYRVFNFNTQIYSIPEKHAPRRIHFETLLSSKRKNFRAATKGKKLQKAPTREIRAMPGLTTHLWKQIKYNGLLATCYFKLWAITFCFVFRARSKTKSICPSIKPPKPAWFTITGLPFLFLSVSGSSKNE